MAGALAGEASLSASIQRLCDKINSVELMDFFREKKIDHSLVEKLKLTFLFLGAVFDYAEKEEQMEKPHVGQWLDELKHAVFDAEDLLHEIQTEVLRIKEEAEFSTKKTQVGVIPSTFLNPFSYEGWNGRIEDLFNKLEYLTKQRSFKQNVTKLPNSLGNLRTLRASQVSDCETPIELPNSLGNLRTLRALLDCEYIKSLRVLSLSGNENVTKLPNSIGNLVSLRVLSLSGNENVTKLPNSIGNLISLRYIDLSHTGIRRLPDIICTLYNLHTLLLSHCSSLIELPADMHKLINLRHVDISGTNIKDMPLWMGRLTNLRKLSTFVVGKSTGASIRELGELPHIEGKLSILKLHDRVDAKDALQANLKGKEDLKELTLKWIDGVQICKDYHNDRDVLDKLQPPENLEKLTIEFYGKNRFPNWLGDSSFSCVRFMRLSHCSCLSLPSLGQLPALKVLFIGGMHFLTTVGPQFYGDGPSPIQPFQRLEKLVFMEMPAWEDWLPSGGQSPAFPCLEELVLKKCPKLRGNLPNHLPSLKKLSVSGCGVLHERATTAFNVELQQSFEELTLDGCPIMLSLLGKEFLTSLQKLEIGNIVNIEGLLNNMVHNSNHIQKLSIWNCPFLTLFPSDRLPTTLTSLHLQECPSLLSFPRDGLPTMLKLLEITNCRKLEFLAHEMIPKFAYLETLNISCSCDSLRSFPLGLFPQLRDLSIWSCVNLESLSLEAVEGEISHLKSLSVFGCKNLKSLPKQLHSFIYLRELRISALPNLESVAEEGLPLNLKVFEVCYCDKLKPSANWRLEESFIRQFSIGGRGSEDLFRTLLEEKLLPTTLNNLYIYGLPSLKSFDGKGLQHLTSLKRLQIHCCDNLEFLPKEGLPISLSFLNIERCSSLKKRYQNKRGDDWSKIAGIRCIKIDGKVIE